MKYLLLWAALLTFHTPSRAADRIKIQVMVNVTCEDAPMRDRIISYLSRSLRKIDDVEVAKTGVCEITLVVAPTESMLVTSYAFLSYYDDIFLRAHLLALESLGVVQPVNVFIMRNLSRKARFETHGVWTMTKTDAAKACQELVDQFDGSTIEGARKAFIKFRDLYDEAETETETQESEEPAPPKKSAPNAAIPSNI